MFKSAKEVQEALEKLGTAEAKITALTAELDGLKAGKTTLDGQITTLTAERDGARTDLAAANAKVTQMGTDHAAAIAKLGTDHKAEIDGLKAGEETRITAAVNERCAAAGVAPIKRDPKAASVGDTKTITRAEFNKLSAAAQSDFCTKGGTITDA